MNNMNSKILDLISLISTDARNYVSNGFENQTVSSVYFEESIQNYGVFCLVENVDCIIAYAAFIRYSHDETLLNLMAKQISRHFNPNETREICFNVYGKNTEIINHVKKLGFATDMEGFHLKYNCSKEMNLPEFTLLEKGFTPDMLGSFIHLFDRAYYDLNNENGWSTDTYQRNPNEFMKSLINYESEGQVRSFWLHDNLIGAYITSGEYIRDFVIDPEYQNRGYGSVILKNCISRMSDLQGMENIILRVAKSNTNAKRFYEKNNFVELSYFAEHTFVPKTT